MSRLICRQRPSRVSAMLPSFLTADPLPDWATRLSILVGSTLVLLLLVLL
jgi:hypothetical protein